MTLLTDLDLGDCARDHGLGDSAVQDEQVEVDEEIVLPAVDEALVDSLVADFQASMPETAAEPARTKGPSGPAADDLYEQAVAAVRERGRGSVIVLQRKLGIGYTRAARILEQLVADGVLGPENASGSHPVL